MQVYRTKRVALKAAAEALRDGAAEVEVGPMLDTRPAVLRGDELRQIVGVADKV
jgi:hypothetical protein